MLSAARGQTRQSWTFTRQCGCFYSFQHGDYRGHLQFQAQSCSQGLSVFPTAPLSGATSSLPTGTAPMTRRNNLGEVLSTFHLHKWKQQGRITALLQVFRKLCQEPLHHRNPLLQRRRVCCHKIPLKMESLQGIREMLRSSSQTARLFSPEPGFRMAWTSATSAFNFQLIIFR